MSKKLNPEEFQQLKAEWYQKLKDSGFVDIESEEVLKKTPYTFPIMAELGVDRSYTTRGNNVRFEAKQSYYRLAEHFLNSHNFESEKHRLIWEHHSKGVGYIESLRILREKGIRISRSSLHVTITKLANIMKGKVNDGKK